MVIGVMLLSFGWGDSHPVFGGQTLTDPTRPPVSTVGKGAKKAQGPSKWRLSSTIIGPQRRVAVINDQAVQVGARIDGAELLAVEPGSAVLLRGGRKIHLKLNARTVKTTP
jgi:MSHA biogenesis protein MshK